MNSFDRLSLFLGLAVWLTTSGGAASERAAAKSQTANKKSAVSSKSASNVLATVDGETLTQADLDRMLRIHQVPEQRVSRERESMIEKLIDRVLIRRHLAKNQVAASRTAVDGLLQSLLRHDGTNGEPADEILKKHGYSAGVIREELEFRLAWRLYVEQREDGNGVREYFRAHHERFDGTEIHARQIVLKVQSDDESEQETAERRLTELRQKIEADELTFETAAREHSAAPSGELGGDVGWFPYRGKMPPEVARVAFALQVHEISRPFRSPYGVHLLQVLERKAGELSLEDVRDQVVTAFGDELWRTTADELRKTAKIQLKPLRSEKDHRN